MFRIIKNTPLIKNYRNFPKHTQALYWITFLGELYLVIPIWIFFYLRFLDFEQIAIIIIVQRLTIVLLELPTGALADLIGKRKTMIVSYILYSFSLLIMPLGSTLLFFVMVEGVIGMAKALASGAFEALGYDGLKEIRKEDQYPKLAADLTTISWIGYIFAGLLGGLAYDVWYALPYIIIGVLYIINVFLFIFFTKEPKVDSEKFSIKGYIKQNIRGSEELFKSIDQSLLVIILLIITLGYFTASDLLGISQAKQYGLNATQVGLLFSVGYVFSAGLSQAFPYLEKKLGKARLLIITAGVLTSSFLFANFVAAIVGGILIIARISSSTTFSNLRITVLNSRISSRNRATALSSFSLLYVLPFVLIVYLAGDYMDKHSPNEFALILGVGMAILLGIFGILLWAKRKLIPKISI